MACCFAPDNKGLAVFGDAGVGSAVFGDGRVDAHAAVGAVQGPGKAPVHDSEARAATKAIAGRMVSPFFALNCASVCALLAVLRKVLRCPKLARIAPKLPGDLMATISTHYGIRRTRLEKRGAELIRVPSEVR